MLKKIFTHAPLFPQISFDDVVDGDVLQKITVHTKLALSALTRTLTSES